MFYSDDELLVKRGLDEVARAIEWSDPNNINHGGRQTTLIAGGPAPPDYTGMTEHENENAKDAYEVKRKAFTDVRWQERMKQHVKMNSAALVNYTGFLHLTLRTMADVEARRLRLGNTFPDIYTLKLHIAEEANLRGIGFMTTRREVRQIRCYGHMIVVKANNTNSANGFMVTVCSVRHGDDYSNLPQQIEKYNVEQEKHSSPFKSAMVVPVILGLIADNPGCTNKTLRGYLKAYGKEYALTDSILQEARTAARTQLFVMHKTDLQYLNSLSDESQYPAARCAKAPG